MRNRITCFNHLQFRHPLAWVSLVMVIILMNSCCEGEDEYHKLPSQMSRYYEENDTITFYSEETDLYQHYIICERLSSFSGDEVKTSRCSWIEYYQGKSFFLMQDSCNSLQYFRIINKKISNGTYSRVALIYENGKSDQYNSIYSDMYQDDVEILGHIYENVAVCIIPHADSLESVLYSKEFGIVQYNFKDLTFNLVRNE